MRNLLLTVLASSSLLCSACARHTQDAPVPPAPKQEAVQQQQQQQHTPSKEEMMAKFQEYSTPGEEHARLNSLIGTWDHEVEWWMDPNAPSEKSRGKTEFKWALDKRFVEQTVEGKFMGQKFTGKGLLGYDKANKEYRSVWLDSMGTGMMVGSGQFDSAKNSIVETGVASCPFEGTVKYRGVTTFIDPRNFTYEMYMTPASGQESRVMKVNYKLKKKA